MNNSSNNLKASPKFSIFNFQFLILLICLWCNAGFAQTIPPANLCGYWSLDGNTLDGSGNNNNGSLQGGATYCPDRFGVANKAVKLGGYYNSSAIKVPHSSSLILNNELTIACWFKLDGAGGMDGWGNYANYGVHTFITKDGDRGGFYLILYPQANGTLNYAFGINNTQPGINIQDFQYDDAQSCINTEWNHVAVVIDEISITMYINGMQKHRQTYSSNIYFSQANNNRHLIFGRLDMSGYIWYPLNGKLDDIVYYNRALSQAEINSLYNYPTPYAPTTSMVATTINDSVNLGEVYEQNGFSLPAQNEAGSFTYSRTNGCDSAWTLNLTVVDTINPCEDYLINEDFNNSNALNNYTQTTLNNGGTATINNGYLVLQNNGGSNGYMGYRDIIHLFPFYPSVPTAFRNATYEISITENSITPTGTYKENLSCALMLQNTNSNNIVGIYLCGRYSGYHLEFPDWGHYNTYNKHYLYYNSSSSNTNTLIIDDLDLNLYYTFELKVTQNNNVWTLYYRQQGQSTWETLDISAAFGSFDVNNDTFKPYIQLASGDGGYTYQNGKGTFSIDYFKVSTTGASTYEYNDTICIGEAYNANGFSFPAQTAVGNFIDSLYLQTAQGCDSIVRLNLTVKTCCDNADANIITEGLIAYYPFNGNANDESGNGYNGTVMGATLTNDRFGNANSAYHFGGYYDSDAIEVPNTLNLSGELTVSLWFKLNGADGMNGWGNYASEGVPMCLYDKDIDGVGFGLYVLYNLATQQITFTTGYSHYSFLNNFTVPRTFAIGEWINITVISGSNYDELFMNCQSVLRQDRSQGSLPQANNHPFRIGRALGNFWYPFNGDIDDIKIYNRALTAEELLRLCYINETLISDTICEGETYSFNGQNISVAGIYSDTLTTAQGCDSIVTLNLTVMNCDVYHPLSLAYTACPGASVTMGFNAMSGVNYYWYTSETGGTPVSGGNPSNNLTVTKDATPLQTWWVEAVYNSITFPRYRVDLELGSCGVTDPVGCAATGTILFKEDFDSYGDGLNPASPQYSPDPLPAGRTTYTFSSTSSTPDGSYGLCKYVRSNPMYAGDWFITNDYNPQNGANAGRLMVINADYSPKTFYRQSIENLCSGSQLYFSAMVANCHTSLYGGIKPNLSYFLWDSINNRQIASFHTGDIPNATQSSDWRQWGFGFVIPDNINTLVLEIKNNQVGGNGNDLGLDNIEIRLCVPPVTLTQPTGNNIVICSGNSLTFAGNYSDDGTFGNNLVYRWERNATGDLNNPAAWTIIAGTQGTATTGSIAATYSLNALTLADSGYYRLVVANAENIGNFYCRAMSEIVHVQIIQGVVSGIVSANQTICHNAAPAPLTSTAATGGDLLLTYQWQQSVNGGTVWTNVLGGTGGTTPNYAPPSLTQTTQCRLITSGGTDPCQTDTSNVVTVTVLPVIEPVVIDTAICAGATYAFNGAALSTAGTYQATFTTPTGCDSAVTLHLAIKLNSAYQYADTVCTGEAYNTNGFSLPVQTAAGNFAHTRHLPNAQGCDSAVTLNLTVKPLQAKTITDTVCSTESYNFYGTVLTTSGTYTATISGAECDTLVTLHLTVNQAWNYTLNISICEGESYFFNGTSYNTTGIYTANLQTVAGCDSIVTLNLTVNSPYAIQLADVCCINEPYRKNGFSIVPPRSPGVYEHTLQLQTFAGCDSVVTLQLTVPEVSVAIEMTPEDFCETYYADLMAVTPNSHIEWSTGETAPTITVTSRGRYTVTVSDSSGKCQAIDLIDIAPCKPLLLLPNTITPGIVDGVNDWFSLSNPDAFEAIEIYIYNRWGNRVFSSQDPYFRWDGTFKGALQSGQTFSYIIYYTPLQDKQQVSTGIVIVW